MRMPKELGPFHIVGIGGIGMSAIAHVMLELGYEVQGSDLADSHEFEASWRNGGDDLCWSCAGKY